MNVTEQAFCQAARELRGLLYHVAYSILKDNSDCEDAVQEALCRAWEKRATLRSEDAFRFWLTRILTNTCLSLRRRRDRHSAKPLDEELPAPPEDESMENQALHHAIGLLPEPLRLVIILYYLEGFSVKEVAALPHRPEGTVRNRLCRAREQLKADLGEEIEA